MRTKVGVTARRFAAVFGVCLSSAVLAPHAHAQAGRPQAREANRLYEQGRYAEAHQKYLEALAEAPGSPLLRFNDGNALYRSEDYARAMQSYLEAAETDDPTIAVQSWYNLGNALFRQQQLQQSLEAYKQALRLDPSDADAKHNLERVLELLQQQQQEQQQDGEQGDQNQQQDPQQNQQQDQPQDQRQSQQDQQDQQQGDQQQEQQDPQGAPDPQGPEQEEGESESPPADGRMTPEEAERLLGAIAEDPDEVNRQRAPVRGRIPRKPW